MSSIIKAVGQLLDRQSMPCLLLKKHLDLILINQYSFIHGGDGGMEYPMATLIKGPGA